MEKMSRKEITKQKEETRQQIKDMLAQIASLQTVPSRVINGSHNEAVAYKDVLETAKAKASCGYGYGSLADLVARKEKIQGWINAIT